MLAHTYKHTDLANARTKASVVIGCVVRQAEHLVQLLNSLFSSFLFLHKHGGESSVRTIVYREIDQRGSKCIEREMKETENQEDERPRRRKTCINAQYSNLFDEKFP